MSPLLALVPALPLTGFLLLAFAGRRLGERAAGRLAVSCVGLCALLVLLLGGRFLLAPPAEGAWVQPLWQWLSVGGFDAGFALRLDPLSLTMAFVVSLVGFLIVLYSTAYMQGEEGYARFFAWICLFIAAMLLLVLADHLLLLYLAWEGVGLCSYLLIGFWYRDSGNGEAARKAFVVTRLGDSALLIGLLVIATALGTLQIPQLLAAARAQWPAGAPIAELVALLLLGGAVGKSAQLPLHTWLPDAMAGPTPVSALIHAATMVTAGVYLIARLHPLYELAPFALALVAAIGAAGALLGAAGALAQRDIKRVLAFSTMSQIGYMFLALGAGAWSAAIFHLMTHAFFKALLFLAAGVVILALGHEQRIDRMGGLWRALPLTFTAFLAGSAALAALPLLTAGFFSKEAILAQVYGAPNGPLLWGAGIAAALLTAIYSTRLLLLVFFGRQRTAVRWRAPLAATLPLAALTLLTLLAGWIELPRELGDRALLGGFLAPVLPHREAPAAPWLGAVAAGASLAGVAIGGLLFRRGLKPQRGLARLPARGFGFDRLYGRLLVWPLMGLIRRSAADGIDRLFDAVAAGHRGLHAALARTQSGRLRWYAGAIAAGSAFALAVVVVPWS